MLWTPSSEVWAQNQGQGVHNRLEACLAPCQSLPQHCAPRHSPAADTSPTTQNTVPWREHAWRGGVWPGAKQPLDACRGLSRARLNKRSLLGFSLFS
jgi:hypothetical protein